MNINTLLCLIIALPLITHSVTAKEFIQKRQIIENYAEKDEFINDKARILKGGYLYGDDIGFFWEATIYGSTPIILKFIPKTEGEDDHGLRECECYEALNAIYNSKVMQYGISHIYFCEETHDKKFHVIGMPWYERIEKKFDMKPKEAGQQLTDQEAVDALLLTEYAMVQVQYAHSKRVRHNHIKPESFVIRGFQLFLTGWNFGERSDRIDPNKPFIGKIDEYTSRKGVEKKQRSWPDDVENLFNVFVVWAKVKKNAQDTAASNKNRNVKDEALKLCDRIGHNSLKKFCKEFHEEAYEPKDTYPNYNKIHDRASFYRKEITRSDERSFFHWLSDPLRSEAKKINWPSLDIPKPPYVGPPPLPNVRLVDQNEEYPVNFRLEDIVQLEMMAKNDIRIDGKIKLVGEKHMATGGSSIVWRAWWERDIVLKFVPEPFKRRAHTEFENHVAMNAYQNKDIERFGIPNLNYFGSILDHRVHALGFSFFESCEEKLNMKYWRHGQHISDAEAANILLLMKYSIIPLKLAHSKDLKHNDLQPNCYYIRGCQVFILDWNAGEIGYQGSQEYNIIWETRRGDSDQQLRLIDDIESSFNVFMSFAKIRPPWFFATNTKMKLDIKNDIEMMRNHCYEINHGVLIKYCREFFDQAYIPEWPDYEKLFHLPDKYLKEITGSDEPVYFQWLKGKELEDAKKFKWPSLSEIPEPPHHTPPPTPGGTGTHNSSPKLSRSKSDSCPTSTAGGHIVGDASGNHPASSADGSLANRPLSNSGGRTGEKTDSRPASSTCGHIGDTSNSDPAGNHGGEKRARSRIKKYLPCCCVM